MNVLNYIAKDLKEGEALQDALSGLNESLWIAGDTARRLITDFSPEHSKSLEIIASCDEHEPTLELLRKSFKLTPITNGYAFNCGPIPVTLRFMDAGDYLISRRYAGECVLISLTKKVPMCTPEFFFAPPTTELGKPELAASKEEIDSLADLILFEAGINERAQARLQANLTKPASEVLNESDSSPVTAVATD